MNGLQMHSFRRPRAQTGAAVVEFAFVFPLLFFLVYGAVVYGYIFMLQEALTFTAQQSAASAVSVAPLPTAGAANAQMKQLAQNTVIQSLSWLGGQAARVTATPTICSVDGGISCPTDGTDAIVVKVIFNVMQPAPLFPVLSFGGAMGLGSLPPMPDQLIAQATVRI